jgi:phosphoribosylglycinamide formyltransferase 1
VTSRLVFLISGAGSNLEAFLQSLPTSDIDAQVVAVGADGSAPGLECASKRNIPTFVVSPKDFPNRDEWGVALVGALEGHDPEWIILSGFMKLLPPVVVDRFSPRIINTHPAYLPEFPGAHGVRDALAAGVSETGASVIVVDAGVDSGPVLAKERVPINPGDTEDSLHQRIKIVERRLLLDVMRNLVSTDVSEKGEPHR